MGAEIEALDPIERTASNAALDQMVGIGDHAPFWASIECKWCADGCPGHPMILTCRECDVDWPCDVAVNVALELDRLVAETDWAWAVGSSLKARASELRGEVQS